jgi:Zn-dependent peptidase ImmA (M78 family)
MNREKPREIEGDLEDLEIREKISDILKSVKKDKDYNSEDIDEKEIISALISQFNNLREDHIAKEGFLTTLEQRVRIIILNKKSDDARKKFTDTMKKIHEIENNISGISKAA